PMLCVHINLASSVTGVSGPTHSTPLCIASFTFMRTSLLDLVHGFFQGKYLTCHPLNRVGRWSNSGGSMSRHLQCTKPCLLYTRKQTFAVQLGMSALGQKQTCAAQPRDLKRSGLELVRKISAASFLSQLRAPVHASCST